MPKKSAKRRREEIEEETPENAQEAKKRATLADRFDHVAVAEARKELDIIEGFRGHTRFQRLRNRLGGTKFNVGADWQYVGPGSEKDREEANNTFGLSTTISKAGLYKDGLYQSELYKGMNILLQDGVAKVIGGAGIPFEKKMEALFSFLSIAKGTNEFEYDFKSVDKVDMDKVNAILKIAKEKGYKVELGPNIQRFLLTNKKSLGDRVMHDDIQNEHISDEAAQERRQNVYKAVNEINKDSTKIQEWKGIKDKIDHFRYKNYAEAIKNEDKVGDKTRQEVTKAAYEKDKDAAKHATDDPQKIKVAIDEIKDIQDRLSQLDTARKALDSDLRTYEARFNVASIQQEAHENKIPEDQMKAGLVEWYEKVKEDRATLVTAIEAEHKDLITRREMWENEVGRIRGDLPRHEDAAPPTELETQVVEAEKLLKEAKSTSQDLGEREMTPRPADADADWVATPLPLKDTAIANLKTKMVDVDNTYTAMKNDPDVSKIRQLSAIRP